MGKTAGIEFFTVVIEQWEPASPPSPLHSSAASHSFLPSAERLAVFQASSCDAPPPPPPVLNVRPSLGRSLSGFKVRHRSRQPNNGELQLMNPPAFNEKRKELH